MSIEEIKKSIKFELIHELIQYKWYRKWKGGTYYLIYNWLPMTPFWSEELITSCGGRSIKTETYEI